LTLSCHSIGRAQAAIFCQFDGSSVAFRKAGQIYLMLDKLRYAAVVSTLGAIRANERIPVTASVEVKHPRSLRRIRARLRDLSTGGCQILTSASFSMGDQVLVTLEGLEPWPAAVAWRRQGCVGLSFHAPLDHSIAEHYGRVFR
jgi:hypothetical protein